MSGVNHRPRGVLPLDVVLHVLQARSKAPFTPPHCVCPTTTTSKESGRVLSRYNELTMLDIQILNGICQNRHGTIVVKMELADGIDRLVKRRLGPVSPLPDRNFLVETQPTLQYFYEQRPLLVCTPSQRSRAPVNLHTQSREPLVAVPQHYVEKTQNHAARPRLPISHYCRKSLGVLCWAFVRMNWSLNINYEAPGGVDGSCDGGVQDANGDVSTSETVRGYERGQGRDWVLQYFSGEFCLPLNSNAFQLSPLSP
jgi:hypothetical protein